MSMKMIHRAAALTVWLLPATVAAQQDPSERLAEVLPAEVLEQVLATIAEARATELPTQAMANLALEGAVKGRSGEEVLAAVQVLVGDMGRAQEALMSAGHEPVEGEVEAATAAMRMGVDAETISELASSQPSGRTLSVPLLVMGGLAQRGLPSDQALAAVADRLQGRTDDASLIGEFPVVGQGLGLGQGGRPEDVGPGMAGAPAGFQVPVAGVTVPVGPQGDNPGQGRGRGRGGAPGGA